jgi:hypothetical protein
MGNGRWAMGNGHAMVIGTLANSQATRYPRAIGHEMSGWFSLAYVDQQSRIVIG